VLATRSSRDQPMDIDIASKGGGRSHSQMLIHDFTPLEISMEEMDHTTGFVAMGI
jgi:hypothetical protein